jgi:hypothetical protein
LSEKFKKKLNLNDIKNEEAVMSQDEDEENVEILFKEVGENESINNEDSSLNKIVLNNKDFVNMNNVKLILSILYHLIAFKLAKPVKVNKIEATAAANTDDDELDLSMKLKDVLFEISNK